jgi:23S rRNA U2552 (ribose-2'-O)-methylase RlmE/FtsJ
MSYFLLPKNNHVNIHIQFLSQPKQTFLNTRILQYYKEAENEINQIIHKDKDKDKLVDTSDCQKLLQTITPYYDSIYQTINNSDNFSVSPLKDKSLLFYHLIEINYLFDLFSLCETNHLSILSVTPNFNNVNYYFDMMTDIDMNDSITCISTLNIDSCNVINSHKYDFIFFEEPIMEDNVDKYKITLTNLCVHENNYVNTIIQILYLIFYHLSNGGTCLIKITNIFEQSFIELMYVCSSLFEKVYIVKPSASNSCTFEKYILCKNLMIHRVNKISKSELDIIQQLFIGISNTLANTLPKSNVLSVVNDGVPCYFMNKIYDFNSMMVQNQLESMEQIIYLLKVKNKEDKFDILKKNNIHKSMMWCEKYKIPCNNKLMEKTNMFLHDLHRIEAK